MCKNPCSFPNNSEGTNNKYWLALEYVLPPGNQLLKCNSQKVSKYVQLVCILFSVYVYMWFYIWLQFKMM